MTEPYQLVKEDPEMLDRMMQDMEAQSPLFRPTNYWQFYEPDTMEYLKNNGLGNFRSYSTSRLASLGAGTYRSVPFNQRYRNIVQFRGYRSSPFMATIFLLYGGLLDRLGKICPIFDILNARKLIYMEEQYLGEFQERQDAQYRYSALVDRISGLNILNSIEDSGVGNPYDLFQINGKQYTLRFLRYFEQMAYVAMNVNLSDINSVMELGGGYGGSVEVYMKSLPNINYFNLDIPPQLYVSQQYLLSVFPGQVYTYRDYLSGEQFTSGKYRIFCLPPWALESMSGMSFALFINSGSFHEMEPDVVQNYYSLIKDKVTYVYLYQLTHGQHKKTAERGGGCVEPLKIDDYISIFKDFELLSRDEYYRIENPCTHLVFKSKG